MPLPLKEPRPVLPNNKRQAFSRLQGLRTKFMKDKAYHKDYVSFMQRIIASGYAERVPEGSSTQKEVWYIPHHGVYSQRKPGKIRVVFDCSARYDSVALNDYLLQGPDTVNSLTGILCRFRQESVAFSCDVEQMFHQFKVNETDRDLLRFLWWQDGNCQTQPVEYRMCVHLFGAASSPGCCTFALRNMADEYKTVYGSDVAHFVHRNFYVDDGLKSTSTESEAIDLIDRTRGLCAEGGLHLHKFVSNAKVLEKIPVEDRLVGREAQPLMEQVMPSIENVLGLSWCIESDTFQFRITLQDKPVTRRGVLSTVGSIYDPLGFVAPVLLTGKKMLQILCKQGADWDSPLPDDMCLAWDR
jgi:hypothetical protein